MFRHIAATQLDKQAVPPDIRGANSRAAALVISGRVGKTSVFFHHGTAGGCGRWRGFANVPARAGESVGGKCRGRTLRTRSRDTHGVGRAYLHAESKKLVCRYAHPTLLTTE